MIFTPQTLLIIQNVCLGSATTVVDCLYLAKDEETFNAIIKAARDDVGIRLVLVYGSIDTNPTGAKIRHGTQYHYANFSYQIESKSLLCP